jgi:hypothetical protein
MYLCLHHTKYLLTTKVLQKENRTKILYVMSFPILAVSEIIKQCGYCERISNLMLNKQSTTASRAQQQSEKITNKKYLLIQVYTKIRICFIFM